MSVKPGPSEWQALCVLGGLMGERAEQYVSVGGEGCAFCATGEHQDT